MHFRRFIPGLAFVLLAGCAGPEGATPLTTDLGSVTPRAQEPGPDLRSVTPPATSAAPAAPAVPGWDRIELDGTVRSILPMNSKDPSPHLIAAGERNGWPLLVDVRDGLAATDLAEQFPLDLVGRLDWVDSDGEDIAVAAQPRTGPPASWSAQYSSTHLGDLERTPVQDAAGRTPGWVRPLFDGEEDYRVVGAVSVGGRWELHAWAAWPDGMLPLDRGGLTAPDPAGVLVGNTESTVVVAGPLTDARGPGRGRAIWLAADVGYTGDPPRWEREELVEPVTDLTDVTCWTAGCYVAGHRAGRPVAVEIDGLHPGPLAVPGTTLDPRRPVVVIADVPVGNPLLLATQTPGGIVLWLDRGKGRWTRIPGPPGVLTDAARVGDGVYVLAGGRLWFRDLP